MFSGLGWRELENRLARRRADPSTLEGTEGGSSTLPEQSNKARQTDLSCAVCVDHSGDDWDLKKYIDKNKRPTIGFLGMLYHFLEDSYRLIPGFLMAIAKWSLYDILLQNDATSHAIGSVLAVSQEKFSG